MINNHSCTPLEKAINAVGGSQKVLAEKVRYASGHQHAQKTNWHLPVKKCASTKKLPGPRELYRNLCRLTGGHNQLNQRKYRKWKP
jgi:hypothetical protein